jgi:hypothetical protein
MILCALCIFFLSHRLFTISTGRKNFSVLFSACQPLAHRFKLFGNNRSLSHDCVSGKRSVAIIVSMEKSHFPYLLFCFAHSLARSFIRSASKCVCVSVSLFIFHFLSFLFHVQAHEDVHSLPLVLMMLMMMMTIVIEREREIIKNVNMKFMR